MPTILDYILRRSRSELTGPQLEAWSVDADEHVLTWIAGAPGLDPATAERLAASSYPEVRITIARRQDLYNDLRVERLAVETNAAAAYEWAQGVTDAALLMPVVRSRPDLAPVFLDIPRLVGVNPQLRASLINQALSDAASDPSVRMGTRLSRGALLRNLVNVDASTRPYLDVSLLARALFETQPLSVVADTYRDWPQLWDEALDLADQHEINSRELLEVLGGMAARGDLLSDRAVEVVEVGQSLEARLAQASPPGSPVLQPVRASVVLYWLTTSFDPADPQSVERLTSWAMVCPTLEPAQPPARLAALAANPRVDDRWLAYVGVPLLSLDSSASTSMFFRQFSPRLTTSPELLTVALAPFVASIAPEPLDPANPLLYGFPLPSGEATAQFVAAATAVLRVINTQAASGPVDEVALTGAFAVVCDAFLAVDSPGFSARLNEQADALLTLACSSGFAAAFPHKVPMTLARQGSQTSPVGQFLAEQLTELASRPGGGAAFLVARECAPAWPGTAGELVHAVREALTLPVQRSVSLPSTPPAPSAGERAPRSH